MVRIFLLCFLLLSGCAVTRTVELDLPNANEHVGIQAGEFIEITLKNGEKHQIKVSSVTESAIKSEQAVFSIEEIEKIERKELTPTGAVAAAGTGAALGLILSAIVSAFLMALIW